MTQPFGFAPDVGQPVFACVHLDDRRTPPDGRKSLGLFAPVPKSIFARTPIEQPALSRKYGPELSAQLWL